jgi:glycosyltransferase involved in cell wall biosynthesis
VHGRVSDTEKQRLFAAATLALNPMRAGSGSNLKIADYAAAGLPVLTSTVGARGFAPLAADLEIFDAGPAGWAAAIDSALDEDWTARTAHARGVVERAYDWRALARRYADVLHAALGR